MHRHPGLNLAIFVVSTCLLAGAPTAVSAAPDKPDRPRGERVLSRAQHGQGAVKALGAKLDRVAARNNLSPGRLREILNEDENAWIAPEGEMYYTEEAPEEILGGATSSSPPPVYPTTQTFALHSRAGAARTIFLDFDGATVENTGWNTGPGAVITNGSHIGWDSDGSPETFSTAEHGWIQEVWREVAETYAAFDVNVTTQDMGPAAWTRSSNSDTTYGTQVLITSSKQAKAEACGSCLGIAYVSTFDVVDPTRYYQPAWVFADNPNFAPMIIAQAASHEAGHTLGLHHDGTTSSSYYAGTAAWGPIMGSSRTRAVSQFSKGEYAGANNTTDDFAVMAANGLLGRPDDHGGSVAAARRLGQQQSFEVSGVISTRTDTDVFEIDLPCTTDLVVNATGIGHQAALDLSLEVLDAAGQRLAMSSPTSSYSGSPPVSSGMDASVTLPATTGVRYLRVDGVGNGDPAGTGWSDYGSLGQYRLTATGCAEASGEATPPGSDDPGSTPAGSTPPAWDPAPDAAPAPAAARRSSAPLIRTASSGARRGPVTAVARWSAPSSTGGAPITKYRVRAERRDSRGRLLQVYTSPYLRPDTRAVVLRLPRGRYSFAVMAVNRVGSSPWSRSSGIVRAR